MLNTVAILLAQSDSCDYVRWTCSCVRAHAIFAIGKLCMRKGRAAAKDEWDESQLNVLNLMIINIFAFHAACVRTNHFSDILCALSSVGFIATNKIYLSTENYTFDQTYSIQSPHKIQLHIHRHIHSTWFILNNTNFNGKATTKYRWKRWNPCRLWTECCCKVKQIQYFFFILIFFCISLARQA